MSDKHHAPAHGTEAAASPGLVARLTAPLTAFLGLLKSKPLVGGGLALGVLAAVIGLGFVITLALPKKPVEKTLAELMAAALDRLDGGDWQEARRIATELRPDPRLSYEELAVPMYVLGVVSSYDAEDYDDGRRRQLLFRVAARYLEEARDRGLPADRQAEGAFLLGKCQLEGGRYSAAILAIEEALAVEGQTHRTELYRLLAKARLSDRPPQVNAGLEALDTYLQDANLAPRDRWSALLWSAKVRLENGDLDGCRDALAAIPDHSPLRPDARFCEARMLLAEGDQLREAGEPLTPESSATAKYQAAIEKLQSVADRSGAAAHLAAGVPYLLGLAHERLGDVTAAETEFLRVRRHHFASPESTAAALHLASQQLADGQALGAVDLLKKTLSAIEGPYENEWEPLSALEARLQATFDQLLQAKDFELALSLAESWTPILPAKRTLLARAEARRSWALHLEQEMGAVPFDRREVQAAEARVQWRKAGELFFELANERRATKFYEDDVWQSAEANLKGWAYTEAVRRCRDFLRENSRKRRPEALACLGQALLAEGKFTEALEAFQTCLEEFPKHPASYRARLWSAAALDELDRPEEAREMLVDNLYNFALTPQSAEWRDSIFALGDNQYRSAVECEVKSRQLGVDDRTPERYKAGLAELERAQTQYLDAVKTLSEAVDRFPQAPQAIEARYHIAEGYRQAAKYPRKRLNSVTIESSRVALNTQMQQYLTSAVDEYAKLLHALDDEQSRPRSPTDAAVLRNCYFSRADALFDLGRYEDAAAAYSAATNRFQHEPEALEAYVQVAACHRRMNKTAEARGTIEQAKVVLRRIRTDADFTRTTRYSREQWGTVLDWLATL